MDVGDRALEKLSLEALSGIRAAFYLVSCTTVSYHRTLVVKYEGEYRSGSAGSPDADYMVAMAEAGLAAWDPSALVLDMQDVRYDWGDNLEALFSVGDDDLPQHLVVVVGPACKEAVRTLVLGLTSNEPLESIPWMFDELRAALDHIDSRLAATQDEDEKSELLRAIHRGRKRGQ